MEILTSPAPNSTLAERPKNGLWPSGWYVFQQGMVQGPLNANEAFAAERLASTSDCFVSRMGWSQWYPARDLADLYRVTEEANREKMNELERLSAEVQRQVEQLQSLERQTGKPTPKVEAPAPKRGVVAKTIKTPEIASPPAADTRPQDPVARYFFEKGRLRLGDIRSPWTHSLFLVPFTLGLSIPFGFARVAQESHWHLTGQAITPLTRASWQSLVPFWSAIYAYRVGCLLRRVEESRGASTCSPALIATLGLIPPLALAYTQQRLNHHWQKRCQPPFS